MHILIVLKEWENFILGILYISLIDGETSSRILRLNDWGQERSCTRQHFPAPSVTSYHSISKIGCGWRSLFGIKPFRINKTNFCPNMGWKKSKLKKLLWGDINKQKLLRMCAFISSSSFLFLPPLHLLRDIYLLPHPS